MDWCSILPWIIGIGAAILGGLIGYYLTRPKMLFYKSGLEDKSKEYDHLNGEYSSTLTAKTEVDQLNTDLNVQLEAERNRINSLNLSLNEATDLNQKLESDVEGNLKQLTKLNAAITTKDTAIKDLESKMSVALGAAKDDCEKNVSALNKKIAELEAALKAKDSEMKKGAEKMSFAASSNQSLVGDLEGKVNDLNVNLAQKENEVSDLEGKVNGLNANLTEKENEVNTLRTKLGELEANFATKEANLNSKINTLEEEATANLSSRGIAMGASPVNADELTNIKSNLSLIPFGNIGSPAATADDLTKLNSISDVEEMKLNLAQINSYKQVSRLQEAEITAVSAATGLDADRIKNEDWVGQARQLLLGAITEKDDLKKIEGIGPKIEGLCNNNGIYTFEELANTSVSALKHVLKEGGNRYRLANPGTWPMQARLAADGEWEQLDILQDILDGGIFKK